MTEEKIFEPVTLAKVNTEEMGRIATKLLFKQYNPNGKEDINVWRERFVAELDPTEYRGGAALVGSWSEWQRFKRNWPSFQRLHLDDWLEEIDVKLKSLALKTLVHEARAGNNPAAAAKFLSEGKYKERKAGRPSKGEVLRQTRIDAQVEKEIANDLERLGL